MNKKVLMNVTFALFAAIISGIILYETVIASNVLGEIGLFGIFLSSLFSHLTVIGRGIFGPTYLLMVGVYHPLVLGSFAAWGGAIGEVTTYYLGSIIRDAVEERKKDIFEEWINRYGLIVIFVLAATPLPDTPLLLLAGSSRFSILKTLFIEGVGKTLFYSFGAVFGNYLFLSLSDVVGNLLSSTIIVIASLIFCIIVSWEKSRKKIFEIGKKIFLKK